MVGHGGRSAGSYLADPTSPIPSHCASIVATSTLRVNQPHVGQGECKINDINDKELGQTMMYTNVTLVIHVSRFMVMYDDV